jgi:gelsolin
MPPRFGGAPKCEICNKSVYAAEKIEYDNKVYHEACFKCSMCKMRLNLTATRTLGGQLHCNTCYDKTFAEGGGSMDAFGDANKPKQGKKKTDGASIEDSNIASYGSKDHKDAKLAAAQSETAWEGAGQVPGLAIWRIENFQVVAWPVDQYGTFYSGDSYIVLRTYKATDENGNETDKLLYDVHFWLGKTTSQDEAGTAAYKTVELDDLLGDVPVQYRETEDNESDKFLACFGGEIKLLEGGVESGFKKVKPEEYEPRLLHIKGKGNKVRVKQVPLEVASLNKGDAFLLDTGLMIYEWHGESAGVAEKNKARDIRMGLVNERAGKPKYEVVDALEDNPQFWAAFSYEEGKKPCPEDIADATDDSKVDLFEKKMFRICDASGQVEITQVATGADVTADKLDTNDVFLVDIGTNLYVWIGNGATKQERSKGMQYAVQYLNDDDSRPISTPVCRVMESAPTVPFQNAFS